MTVRRLADDQGIEFSFDKDDMQSIETLMGKYPEDKKQSAVVPCLFYAQKKPVVGYLKKQFWLFQNC